MQKDAKRIELVHQLRFANVDSASSALEARVLTLKRRATRIRKCRHVRERMKEGEEKEERGGKGRHGIFSQSNFSRDS